MAESIDVSNITQLSEQHQLLEDLLLSIATGDENSLSQFYDGTVDRVYSLAYSILRNSHDAEEVVSDAFAQVWHQAGNYRPGRGSVMTWLLVICRSRAIDNLRKRKPEQSLDDQDHLTIDETDSVISPEYLLDQIQHQNQLHKVLGDLEPLQRQMISLAFFRDLSHQQIADIVQMPLGTVKSHIRRALMKLKDCFELERLG